MIHEYQCIPVERKMGNTAGEQRRPPDTDAPLALVTLWPPDDVMDRWIFAVTCGRKAQWHYGRSRTNHRYHHASISGSARVASTNPTSPPMSPKAEEDEDEDAAVIRFVNEVVQKAMSDRATDIHFEPHRDELQIRYRIDGELVADPGAG